MKKINGGIHAGLFFLLAPFVCLAQNANDYFNNALLKDSMQDYRGTLKECTDAIQADPAFAKAYYLRGKASYYLKDYKGAIKDVNKAAQLHLQNENVYLISAYARQALNQYTAAVQDFNKAIVFNPENSLTWYHRGFANLQLHNKKKARTDFTRATELGIKESGDITDGFHPYKKNKKKNAAFKNFLKQPLRFHILYFFIYTPWQKPGQDYNKSSSL